MSKVDIHAKCKVWLDNKYNVLFEGSHGIGKSAIIIDAFDSANLKWKYFSGATLDPWVDFIGVPKEKIDKNGISYLDLIRPKEFENDEVEAIFFDEFNRAPPKVRNAVMELIQFGSINGRKFNNLKVIWAAINPADEDGTYDVDELDPAQRDRFEVHYTLPHEPDTEYFVNKFSHIGQAAITWWETIPKEHQSLVSPRRLEYAVIAYNNGVDLSDILPAIVRPRGLKTSIESIGINQSSHERWLADPETFIASLVSRSNNQDIVEAFQSLSTISVDNAVDYISRLPPAKLLKIVQDSGTISLALKAKPSKALTKALNSVSYQDDTIRHICSQFVINKMDIDSSLIPLIIITETDKLSITPWESLLLNVQRGVEYDTAVVIMAAASIRLKDVHIERFNSNKLVKTIITLVVYLYEYYNYKPNNVGEINLLHIDPVLINNALWFTYSVKN